MDIRDTIKATNTAIATADLVKDYGSGNNTVHALRGVNVAFEKENSRRLWDLPVPANPR